jgi:hypothetical protein
VGKVYVSPQEFVEILKLNDECSEFDKFDAARWVVGLAVIFGTTVEELRQHAGSFPDGSMTEVVVCHGFIPPNRWEQ